MQPTRNNALVDLIDRIMVKGVVVYADLIISVAEIPLVGVNLRAAIAGIKTMLDYGMMGAWDEEIRKHALQGDKRPLDAPLNASGSAGGSVPAKSDEYRSRHIQVKEPRTEEALKVRSNP